MKHSGYEPLSWYVPTAYVDHTISVQGTAISILDQSATPKVSLFAGLLLTPEPVIWCFAI